MILTNKNSKSKITNSKPGITNIKRTTLLLGFVICFCGFLMTACHYKFSDTVVDKRIKTAKVNLFENEAQYNNPQLTPALTSRLVQKLNNQTKLSMTSSDNADLIIGGKISDYYLTTSGVTSADGKSTASINRINITVKMSMVNKIDEKASKEFSVSRQFDFPASQSQQQAESVLLDEMVRNLTDEIFNQLFSNW